MSSWLIKLLFISLLSFSIHLLLFEVFASLLLQSEQNCLMVVFVCWDFCDVAVVVIVVEVRLNNIQAQQPTKHSSTGLLVESHDQGDLCDGSSCWENSTADLCYFLGRPFPHALMAYCNHDAHNCRISNKR